MSSEGTYAEPVFPSAMKCFGMEKNKQFPCSWQDQKQNRREQRFLMDPFAPGQHQSSSLAAHPGLKRSQSLSWGCLGCSQVSLLLLGGLHSLLLLGSCGRGRSTWPVLLFSWGLNGKSIFLDEVERNPVMLLPNKLIQFWDPSVLMLSEACLQPPAQAGLMKAGRKMSCNVWEGDEVLEKGRWAWRT